MTDAATTALAITSASLPTLAVLVGILVNRTDANRLDGRITNLEARMEGRIASLESSLRAEIASSRNQSHAEFLLLLGRDDEIDKRLTQLESRS